MSGIAAPAVEKLRLAEADGIAIDDVRCSSLRGGWSAPQAAVRHAIVFVRRGCFRRLADGVEAVHDAVSMYCEHPGQIQQFAHPLDGGDRCTQILLDEDVLASITGGEPILPRRPLYTTPEIDLEHRLLLAAIRNAGDDLALSENVAALVASITARTSPDRVASGRPTTAIARRRTVDQTREALAADTNLGLMQLARIVAVSPHHLSRIFKAETGETISRYRNRLRVRLAMERLAEGDDRLARLAGDLGFADQAHFSRVVRSEVGTTPRWLRGAFVERLR
jgi:AraC-like DNA-binding protein